MNNKIRINQGRVMNGWFRYAFTLVTFCSTIVIVAKFPNIFGFLVLLLLAFLLIMAWTSFYLVEIDMDKKEYGDYTVVLGRKSGGVKPYPGIEDVFIKKFNTTQHVTSYGTGSQHHVKDVSYQAYLKFTNEDRLELVSDKDENRLVERLEPVVKKLRTSIRRS